MEMEQHLLDELDTVIRTNAIRTLLQPIVHLEREAFFGYEALSRGPSGGQMHSPEFLFHIATRAQRLFEVERVCRDSAIRHFTTTNQSGHLFLNVSPVSLVQPDHRSGETRRMLQQTGLDPGRVVIELTEQEPLDDYAILRQAVEHYRAMGFRIAIDDLGAGYAGLRMWSELRPDFVKIDKHFIQGIHEDEVKREFVRSIITIAAGLNCQVIAEGVEVQEEYRTVAAMGIPLAQGYYFARPDRNPPRAPDTPLFALKTDESGYVSNSFPTSNPARQLLREQFTIAPTATLDAAFEHFHNDLSLRSLPVVDERGYPLGLVRRFRLMEIRANEYGRALYGRKPIVKLLDESTVCVDENTSLEQVSQVITETMQQRTEEDFIITRGEHYLGIGKVMDLMRVITKLQLQNARHANPLTQLPGNVPIQERLETLLESRADFAVAYCDLDNFKPFNDTYGYAAGDNVIVRVAELLKRQTHPQRDFVGHIGGDDFIVIFTSPDWLGRCEAIRAQFEGIAPEFYNEADRQRGGIQAQDRAGEQRLLPLLSVSIGIVHAQPDGNLNHHELATMASEAKKQAKKRPGNSLFLERRTPISQAAPDD